MKYISQNKTFDFIDSQINPSVITKNEDGRAHTYYREEKNTNSNKYESVNTKKE